MKQGEKEKKINERVLYLNKKAAFREKNCEFIEFKEIPIQNLYSNLYLFSLDSLSFSFVIFSVPFLGINLAENNNLSFILISYFSNLYKLSWISELFITTFSPSSLTGYLGNTLNSDSI